MEEPYRIVAHGNNMGRRHLALGFLRAFYRFAAEEQLSRDIHETSAAQRRAHMALFEALNWLTSFQDFMHLGPAGRKADPAWIEALNNDQAKAISGLSYARNLIHHRWWEILALDMLMTENGQVNTWIWSGLPGGGRGSKHALRSDYEDALLGQPAIKAMTLVRDALWEWRGNEISEEDLHQPTYPLPHDAWPEATKRAARLASLS